VYTFQAIQNFYINYENLYFEANFFKILEYIFKNDNLTTCKLCFTSIILHANSKQKPKSVLQKKIPIQFLHSWLKKERKKEKKTSDLSKKEFVLCSVVAH
jgi:hypothetical protein